MEINVVLFVVALLCAIGAVSIALVRQVLYYSRRAHVARIGESNRDLSRKQEELTKAYRDAQEAVRQTEVERKAASTQLADAERRLKAAGEENYIVVHELGEPSPSRRPFVVQMTLGSVLTINQNTIKDCRFRTVRHVVEIWAENAEDANRMARAQFPPDGGFSLSKAVPASQAAIAAE